MKRTERSRKDISVTSVRLCLDGDVTVAQALAACAGLKPTDLVAISVIASNIKRWQTTTVDTLRTLLAHSPRTAKLASVLPSKYEVQRLCDVAKPPPRILTTKLPLLTMAGELPLFVVAAPAAWEKGESGPKAALLGSQKFFKMVRPPKEENEPLRIGRAAM